MNKRRVFFQNMPGYAMDLIRAAGGQRPKYKIEDVAFFSDDQFHHVIPQIRLGHHELDDQGNLFVFENETPKYLFSMSKTEQELFNLFDGKLDIYGIGNIFAAAHDLDESEAFIQAKALFLRLSQMHICYPRNIV